MEAGGNRDSGDALTHPTAILMQVVGAIAAGVGVLGFVILLGGAIAWVRFEEAGVSASQAVAVVPREVHVATGASFLFPAAVLAFVAVVALVLYYWAMARKGDARLRLRQEEAEAAASAHAKALTELAEAEEMVGHARAALDQAPEGRKSDELRGTLAEALEQARHAQDLAQRACADTASAKENAAQAHLRMVRREKRARMLAVTSLLLVGEMYLTGWVTADLGLQANLVLIATAFGTVVVAFAVFARTSSLLWFGVSAFIAVGVFSAMVTYKRTREEPKLEPVSVLRQGGRPVLGFLVAQKSDRVFIGLFRKESGAPARILSIPLGKDVRLAVGPLTSLRSIPQAASALASEQCRDRRFETTGAKERRRAASACRPGDLTRHELADAL